MSIFGQTQMGKTTLVEHLLEDQPRVIAVDSKEMLTWKGYFVTDNPIAALLEAHVIYRPPGGIPPEGWWMQAVRSLHERGGGVIVVDEGSYVTGANTIQKGLADAIRLGAQLGVGIWFLAQESTTVHNTTLRQADIIIMFYNQGSSDRDKLARTVGDMGHVTAHLDAYEFVVFERGKTYDHEAVPVYTLQHP